MWAVLGSALLAVAWATKSSVIELEPTLGQSSNANPLKFENLPNLTLWCSANYTINNATFMRGTETWQATTVIGNNATFEIEHLTVLHVGDYNCVLNTDKRIENGLATINMRPIPHFSRHAQNFEVRLPDEGIKWKVNLNKQTVTEGDELILECPAIGHPKPAIIWKKDGKALNVSGSVFNITNVGFDDVGEYECHAVNSFRGDNSTNTHLLMLFRKVNVKSKFSWLWPLAVIAVILVVLIITIALCEMRKKKRDKLVNTYAVED